MLAFRVGFHFLGRVGALEGVYGLIRTLLTFCSEGLAACCVMRGGVADLEGDCVCSASGNDG